MKLRSLIVAGTTVAAVAAAPHAALALDSTPQVVAGTTASTLSLSVPTAAAFGTGFAPNNIESASTGGTLTALSTSPNWTLSVKDYGTDGTDGNGTMDKLSTATATSLVSAGILADAAAATAAVNTCATSASELAQAVKVRTVPATENANIVSAAKTALNGSGVTVANSAGSGATLLPLAATIFNTTFYQTIASTENVSSGCIYTIKAAYTLS